ncbi:MAG TPA: Fe-S oxidoreductase [Acidiferrobacteraceae bacterium]|nr:Fe-S oxidoreductase [Acidiferrobacteraceae bacterium]HEX19469.1 Fe-S oxidoreductase [Acidiferrobacteraceae bacterium]
MTTQQREGSLEAPTRHPLDWLSDDFYNEETLNKELERVYDICHGCRRCVNLCNAFPTLFDLVDESSTMEVDGVDKKDYVKVVDECYLCDLCYMTKCPYVPPHEWGVDFPHLMLRAKAIKFRKGQSKLRDRIITSTDRVGKLASLPVVVTVVNKANKSKSLRSILSKIMGIHPDAHLPEYHRPNWRQRHKRPDTMTDKAGEPQKAAGKLAIFATCYANYNAPQLGEDLLTVLHHNNIKTRLTPDEVCCGMPKLELGDLEAVARAKEYNIPILAKLVDDGWDLSGIVPSCVLMFKQELPLMYPDDADVKKVAGAFYDPFEYLMLRHKEGTLKTDFKNALGKVSYHAACHQRVQNIGQKTRQALELVPGTTVEVLERCSGHDGTYAVKNESHAAAVKICRPITRKIQQSAPDHYGSDCPIAGTHIEDVLSGEKTAEHPIHLLRIAYGI